MHLHMGHILFGLFHLLEALGQTIQQYIEVFTKIWLQVEIKDTKGVLVIMDP